MTKASNKIIIALALLVAAVLWLPKGIKALTPAGVIINNQATATYTDASSLAQATSSNLVQTLVKEVVGVLLTTPLSKAVAAGDTYYFPHFLTNIGNGPESYTLCLDQETFVGTDDFDFDSVNLFLDDDQNGLPDSGTPFVSSAVDPTTLGLPASALCFQVPALNGGEAIQVVVEATTPAVLSVGDIAQYSVSAYADSDNTVTGINTDDAFVTDQPIVEVLKAISETQGISPSGPYTITLTYRNISAIDAQNIEITDLLPTDIFPTPDPGFERNAGMTYVAGSASWSHDGATAVTLTDDSFTPQTSGASDAVYCAYDVACNTGTPFGDDRLVLQVDSILAGEEGVITFDVDIDAGLFDSDVLRNVAQYKYESIIATPIPTSGTLDSNAVTFVVINAVSVPAVVANDSDSSLLLGVDDADDLNNIVSVAEIEQGGVVTFENYIWNSGDGIDSFDITIDNVLDREGNALPTPFPVGTIYQLFQADGVIALLDTNGNSTPDTGPVNPGESYKVVLRVTPPATEVGDNSGNGWDVTKVATSFADANVSNAVTDRLLEITQSIIDLTNAEVYDTDCVDGDTDPNLPVDGDATPLATGCGALVFKGEGYPNGEASPVTSYTVEAGQTIYIPVWAHNVGEATDTFSLNYSSSNFSAGSLPVGWSVRFYDSNGATNCATPGNIIVSTGPLPRLTAAPANKFLACAELSIASDVITTGTEQSLFFRALSPTSGVFDIKHDGVTVTPAPLLAIEPGHFGQVKAGDTIDYPHIVSNYGNTAIECINIALADELAADGWTSAVFLDVDEDTEFSAGDVALIDQVLQPGEQFTIIVQVTAPAVVGPTDVNHTTVTVNGNIDDNDANPASCTGDALTDLVTNDTSVAPTSLQIVKSQAPDANCDSVADSAFVLTPFQVLPAECVIYKLLATNFGTETAFTVVVNDDTPEYTVYNINAESCAAVSGTPAVCSPPSIAPIDGGTGNITWSISELLPSGTITTTFGVKVE